MKSITTRELKVHMIGKCIRENPLKCSQCNTCVQLRIEGCNICEYSCITNDQLKVHMMRKHTVERYFKCNQCNYVLASCSNLQQGIRRTLWTDHSSATIARKLTSRSENSRDMLRPTRIYIKNIFCLM